MTDKARKTAIITAAGSGLGAGCARYLAKRGWRLALLARSDQVIELARELDGIAVCGDITNASDLRHLVDTAVEEFGMIDGAVISTGHPRKGELLGLTSQEWHTGLDLTVMPLAVLLGLLLPVFRKSGGGSIVTISSHAAVQPNRKFAVSGALRAALSNYTRLVAREYAGDGVRVNSIMPGFIDNRPIDQDWLAKIPAGRYGTVDELAGVVEFFLSDQSGYVTGQNLLVDGGLVAGI
ncbi:SDR family oxidoreductase [Mesorhizobium sp. NPDC059054]|uniref:SDR family oxidoreductase n=1 Tax=Mesorhizobium sp. NPDC059054 TaxID=3346711 RepID=UPI0036ADB968